MHIEIRDTEYNILNNMSNSIFTIHLNKDKIRLINNITHQQVVELSHVDELDNYGFDIKVINRASMGVIESIADENGIAVTYKNGKWYYIKYGDINLLNNLLKDYGYYI